MGNNLEIKDFFAWKQNRTRTICIIAVSLMISFGLSANINRVAFFSSFDGNSIIYVATFLMSMFLFNYVAQVQDRRLKKVSAFGAAVIAFIEIIGFHIQANGNLYGIYSSMGQMTKNILKLVGLFLLFYGILVLVFDKMLQADFTQKPVRLFGGGRKAFFIMMVICFAAFIPYFIINFPASMSYDPMYQIEQITGARPLTDHHTLIHTLLMGLFVKIGELFGSLNTGMALFAVFQMLMMSATFAGTVYYLGYRSVHKGFQISLLLCFAFLPLHGQLSVTLYKDVPFACVVLLFMLLVIEIAYKKADFFKNKWMWALFTLSAFCFIIFRNNGLHALVLAFPFMLILLKGCRKQLLISAGICLVLVILYKGPLYSVLGVSKGRTAEALSVPVQQIARVVTYHKDELTQEEWAFIEEYFTRTNLDELYNPILSNPVKSSLRSDYFDENPGGFIKMWLKMFFKYPKVYVESFLCNNFGYWYPERVNWSTYNGIHENDFGIQQPEPLKSLPGVVQSALTGVRYIPIISLFLSIGFYIIVFFLTAIMFWIKRQHRFIAAMLPVFTLWLTTLASPINTELRYIYCLFLCMPVMLIFALHVKAQEKDPSKEKRLRRALRKKGAGATELPAAE